MQVPPGLLMYLCVFVLAYMDFRKLEQKKVGAEVFNDYNRIQPYPNIRLKSDLFEWHAVETQAISWVT